MSPCLLEKIRFSITRLKRQRYGTGHRLRHHPWKDKILDYEIETKVNLGGLGWGWVTWKDKILDYEIETEVIDLTDFVTHTWKDKILDYEIETPCHENSRTGG